MDWFLSVTLALSLALLFIWISVRGLSGFHLLSYKGSPSGAATTDLTANVDGEFSTRNNHYIFSEQYYLLGVSLYGSTATGGTILSPTLNAITQFNIWPLNDSTVSASPPRMDFWMKSPVPLPLNEEIQVQCTTTGADTVTAMMIVGTQGWNQTIPPGLPPLPVFEMRFDCTPTLNSNSYSTLVNPTFTQNLRGGTYAVVGAEWQGTGLLAARLVFPQAKIYQNRRLRPGSIASQSIGDLPVVYGERGPLVFGEWGQFTTAELPMIEALGVGTSTIAMTGRLRLVRVSESINVNYGGATY